MNIVIELLANRIRNTYAKELTRKLVTAIIDMQYKHCEHLEDNSVLCIYMPTLFSVRKVKAIKYKDYYIVESNSTNGCYEIINRKTLKHIRYYDEIWECKRYKDIENL